MEVHGQGVERAHLVGPRADEPGGRCADALVVLEPCPGLAEVPFDTVTRPALELRIHGRPRRRRLRTQRLPGEVRERPAVGADGEHEPGPHVRERVGRIERQSRCARRGERVRELGRGTSGHRMDAIARTGNVPVPTTGAGTALNRNPSMGSCSRPVRCSTIGIPARSSSEWAGRAGSAVESMLSESIPTSAAPSRTRCSTASGARNGLSRR